MNGIFGHGTRRGQIAIFMLAGFVVLVIAALFLLSNFSSTTQSAQSDFEAFANEQVAAAAVEFHVTSCLDKALEEGMSLIGLQGGFIHSGQPGNILPAPVPFIEYEDKLDTNADPSLVTYRIERGRFGTLPAYPCRTGDNAPLYCGFTTDAGLFPDLATYTFGISRPLFLYNTSSYFSVENELNAYVEDVLPDCINFTRFQSYDITAGNLSVQTRIKETSVTTALDFPITVMVQGVEPIIKKYSFDAEKDSNLKRLHQAILELISLDTEDITFNIIEDTRAGEFNGRKLGISQFNYDVNFVASADGLFDDIIQVVDLDTRFAGKQFTYQFSRQNRPLALNLITGNVINQRDFDFVLRPGETLLLEPLAHDPDEDVIGYSFSAVDTSNERTVAIAEALHEHSLTQTDSCFRRCAEYRMLPFDTGEHEIRVSATDGEFSDFQIIRIKVTSLLQAQPTGANIYSAFDNIIASIEDPYLLDGSESVGLALGEQYVFKWSDPLEDWWGGIPGGVTTPECLLLQTHGDCEDVNDYSLMDPTASRFTTTGDHEVTLSVSYVVGSEPQTDNEIMTVNVTQCFPFRSVSPTYPYSNASIASPPLVVTEPRDLYFGNHTCCTDGFTVGTGRCFEASFGPTCAPRGQQRDIRTYLGTTPVVDVPLPDGAPSLDLATSNLVYSSGDCQDSDICELVFHQSCGGRGNACSGPFVYTWRELVSCDPQCEMPCNRGSGNCFASSCPFDTFDPSIRHRTGLSCVPVPIDTSSPTDAETFTTKFLEDVSHIDNFYCDSGPAEKCWFDSSLNKYIDGWVLGDTANNKMCRKTCDGVGGCNRLVPYPPIP